MHACIHNDKSISFDSEEVWVEIKNIIIQLSVTFSRLKQMRLNLLFQFPFITLPLKDIQ